MQVLHLRTDVGPWACADLARLDAALAAAGSTPVDLPWENFALEEDGEHFTDAGADAFARALADALAPACRGRTVLVLADSTIDHNDRDTTGAWHGGGTRRVIHACAAHGVRATVDALWGTGYVARAHASLHFRSRLAAYLRAHRDRIDVLLLVGGWNDVHTHHPCERVCAAAEACVALALRG